MSVCLLVALDTQHAMRMRHTVICGMPRSRIFFRVINGTIFRRKSYSTQNVFLVSLQLLSETFPILRRTERDMIKMYIGLHVKYPLFLSDFNET